VSCSRWSCRAKYCRGSASDPVCTAANAACWALKKPWELLLAPAQESLRQFQNLLAGAEAVLRGAESVFRSASSGLDRAKEALDKAEAALGSVLNVVSAIAHWGLDNLFRIHSTALKASLNLAKGGNFGASIDATIIGNRVRINLQMRLASPTSLINYAVDYIKRNFRLGRKKRHHDDHNIRRRPKWLSRMMNKHKLPNLEGKGYYSHSKGIDKVLRLANLCKQYGNAFSFFT
jgi:hypothetical protein